MTPVRLNNEGRLTIPRPVREALNLQAGDVFSVEIEQNGDVFRVARAQNYSTSWQTMPLANSRREEPRTSEIMLPGEGI